MEYGGIPAPLVSIDLDDRLGKPFFIVIYCSFGIRSSNVHLCAFTTLWSRTGDSVSHFSSTSKQFCSLMGTTAFVGRRQYMLDIVKGGMVGAEDTVEKDDSMGMPIESSVELENVLSADKLKEIEKSMKGDLDISRTYDTVHLSG